MSPSLFARASYPIYELYAKRSDVAYWTATPPGNRKFLSADEFAATYGAEQTELDQVAGFARLHGLSVTEASASRRRVVVLWHGGADEPRIRSRARPLRVGEGNVSQSRWPFELAGKYRGFGCGRWTFPTERRWVPAGQRHGDAHLKTNQKYLKFSHIAPFPVGKLVRRVQPS